jgi:hypothetical protein
MLPGTDPEFCERARTRDEESAASEIMLVRCASDEEAERIGWLARLDAFAQKRSKRASKPQENGFLGAAPSHS